MTPLKKLSNELIGEILSYCDTQDLAKFNQTCQLYYQLSEPYLYSKLTQSKGNALPIFVQSLVRKPHLMKFLKHLEVTAFDAVPCSILSEDDRHLIQELVPWDINTEGLNYGLHEVLAGSDPGDLWEALTTILLIACPNIETFRYTLDSDFSHGFINRVLEWAEGSEVDATLPQQALKRLRKVHSEAQFLNLSHPSVEPLHGQELTDAIKSVTEIVNERFCDGVFSMEEFERSRYYVKSRQNHTLKRLSFIDSQPTVEYLEYLLPRYHSLNSFIYECHEIYDFDGRSHFLVPSSIKDSLKNSKHCLETLKLTDHEYLWHDIDEFDALKTPFGSFAEFTSLRYLQADPRMLLGREGRESPHAGFSEQQINDFVANLPPNLEELVIIDCYLTIYSCLYKLFSSGNSPKKLKKVAVAFENVVLQQETPGFTEQPWAWKEASPEGDDVVWHTTIVKMIGKAYSGEIWPMRYG